MATTTPSPSAAWRTESPVARDGTSARGATSGAGDLDAQEKGRSALAHDLALRQLVEEARREVVRPRPEQRPRGGMRERQALLRARHADVGETPFLLDPLLLDRAHVREDPLLHADEEHRAELEALRVVDRHQRDERLLVAQRVLVGVERDVLEEAGERGLLGLLLVLARDADELLEVLHAAA